MSYALYDFIESLKCARRDAKPEAPAFDNDAMRRVVAAYGDGGGRDTNDYEDWYGGFLIEMKDGRFAYLTGSCDTTGWGCQDGAEVEWFDTEPELSTLKRSFYSGDSGGPTSAWDIGPADLNKWIADGCDESRYE